MTAGIVENPFGMDRLLPGARGNGIEVEVGVAGRKTRYARIKPRRINDHGGEMGPEPFLCALRRTYRVVNELSIEVGHKGNRARIRRRSRPRSARSANRGDEKDVCAGAAEERSHHRHRSFRASVHERDE